MLTKPTIGLCDGSRWRQPASISRYYPTKQSPCLMDGFWLTYSGWCWFVVRKKHCWISADKLKWTGWMIYHVRPQPSYCTRTWENSREYKKMCIPYPLFECTCILLNPHVLRSCLDACVSTSIHMCRSEMKWNLVQFHSHFNICGLRCIHIHPNKAWSGIKLNSIPFHSNTYVNWSEYICIPIRP
jgi:hypothetical protein